MAPSQHSLPRLLANAADVCAQKILVAARAAEVEVVLDKPAKGQAVPELHKGDRVIKYTNAILRFIGKVMDGSEIYGRTFLESAQVDSWLDWGEMELGHTKPPKLQEAVAVLEKHLDGRVFLVGDRYSLADASLSTSLYHFEKGGLISQVPRATKRWLNTCTAHQAFRDIFKDAAPPTMGATAPPAAAAASPAAPAPAGAAPSAGPGGEEEPIVARYSSCVGGRSRIVRILGSPDGGKSFIGKQVTVCGWVKTMREQKECVFLEVNDGSCAGNIQVVIAQAAKGFQLLHGNCGTGASVKCIGQIVEPPAGVKQFVELRIAEQKGDEISLFGSVDAKDYPMAKARLPVEFLREHAHLRPRSNLIAAVARVRAALALATHQFFGSRGFFYVHTPLITAADCEGAGEMFQVTTMMGQIEKEGVPKTADGKIDYKSDFFKKPAFLTVSGQLSVENYCCALSSVYTFGPTFRAENSHTNRHLAEFWMIEPELAFADIKDDMDCAEDYLKYCIQWVMDRNLEDLQFFDDRIEKGLIARLQNLLAEPFARVTYTEAIDILLKESKKVTFNVPVEWGMDLGSEHERHLAEKVKKKPTIVYNYPKDIKAFYMRLNEDNKTVAAMDVLAPAIGEVIGGSQREERLDVLDRRIQEMGLEPKDYWWYRDLRRFGTVPHAGFGLGFERLIMLTTGVENIRDVIPYPRYPGHAEF